MEAQKRTTAWAIERTDWFGDCEEVAHFDTEAEAKAALPKFRSHAKNCESRRDRVRYRIVSYEWWRDAEGN